MAEKDLKWRYDTGKTILSGLVVGSDGVIYFGTLTLGGNADVYAINPDGSLKWTTPLPNSIYSGLALSNDESVVYIGCTDLNLYALYTLNGNQKWSYNLGEVYSGITVDINDNIYFGTFAPGWGLVSVDYGGNFRYKVASENHSGMAIGKSNTVIYFLDVSFGLREVRLSDGNLNWSQPCLSWGAWATGIQIANDGTIYYGDSGFFNAVNPDGSVKWNYAVTTEATTNNAIGTNNNIWFVDRADPSIVIVVKPDSTLVWSYTLPSWCGSGRDTTGLALDSNNIAYLACADSKLHALNSDGTHRWSYTAGDVVRSGIAFSPSEDTVYFGSDDHYLYALEKLPAPLAGGGSSLPILAKILL